MQLYDFLDSPIHPTKNYILRAPIQYMYLEINVNADVRSEDSTKVGLQVLSLALFTILSMLGEVTLCRDIILILFSCVDCTFQVVQYGIVLKIVTKSV